MMEKHGEKYEAMARDHKNYYQLTPSQIRKQITLFKKMSGPYQKYLKEKERGVDHLSKLEEKF